MFSFIHGVSEATIYPYMFPSCRVFEKPPFTPICFRSCRVFEKPLFTHILSSRVFEKPLFTSICFLPCVVFEKPLFTPILSCRVFEKPLFTPILSCRVFENLKGSSQPEDQLTKDFIMQQLLKLAGILDLSDEFGRFVLLPCAICIRPTDQCCPGSTKTDIFETAGVPLT